MMFHSQRHINDGLKSKINLGWNNNFSVPQITKGFEESSYIYDFNFICVSSETQETKEFTLKNLKTQNKIWFYVHAYC